MSNEVKPVDCALFRRRLYHDQAGELPPDEREAMQAHRRSCPACARLDEVERGLLRVLRDRLAPPGATPAGLETRLRAALAAAAGPANRGAPRRMWLPALAASLLLGLLLVPGLIGERPSWPDDRAQFDREVTVVDLQCDRAGLSYEVQRRCRHRGHVNAIKLAEGEYLTIAVDSAAGRRLIGDPDVRGRRFHVVGRYDRSRGVVEVDRAVSAEIERTTL